VIDNIDFNKISGWQMQQVVQIHQCFGDKHHFYHQRARAGLWNISVFKPLDKAASQRRFYWILSLKNLQDIHQFLLLKIIWLHTFVNWRLSSSRKWYYAFWLIKTHALDIPDPIKHWHTSIKNINTSSYTRRPSVTHTLQWECYTWHLLFNFLKIRF